MFGATNIPTRLPVEEDPGGDNHNGHDPRLLAQHGQNGVQSDLQYVWGVSKTEIS